MKRVVPLIAAFCLAALPLSADVVRTATGQRRVELDKMELQAFPSEAWGKLSGWTGGDAITPTSSKDKPILIMTWASWHPASLKALALAQKMADVYGGQGLIVVGVHHQNGWADAPEAAKSRGAKFTLALDTAGEFRKAIKSDHDPDFYVIDRAGHLRFASIASQSLDEACSTVVTETAQAAADLPNQLRTKAASEAAASQKIETVRSALEKMPAVPPSFTKPGDDAYKEATWPKIGEKEGKDYGLTDSESKPLSPKFAFAPQGYFPSKPETVGRVTVCYLWNPEILTSFDKVLPMMDQLQVSMARDLAVIGAVVPAGKLDTSRQLQFGQTAEPPEKMVAKVKEFMATRTFRHTLAADASASSLAGMAGMGSIHPSIPFVLIVSSDGLVRWAGNPTTADFRYALESVLANDPGVAARRAADQKYLREAK
jgi:hypothetical protein